VKSRLYIESADQPDAVRIMTVHKSKGLQFPVVLYPRFKGRPHASTIWVDPSEELPSIPAALATFTPSPNKEHPFPEMQDEQDQQQLDELNICYVATTRAEERLYLFIESPAPESLDQAILQVSQVTDELTEKSYGQPGARSSAGKEKKKTLLHVTGNSPLHFLTPSIRMHAPATLKEEEADDPRKTGELVHACLSLIRYPDDLEHALRFVLRSNGSGGDRETAELCQTVLSILQNPVFSGIFQPGQRVLNERDIVLEDGRIIRPDRVIQYENEWQVIDFKTGSPRPHHLTQVQEYMKQLSRITSCKIKGYLAYTGHSLLQEVHL
jgi:ATP-dependent exoDNAse (exonuclease V) beta subunit